MATRKPTKKVSRKTAKRKAKKSAAVKKAKKKAAPARKSATRKKAKTKKKTKAAAPKAGPKSAAGIARLEKRIDELSGEIAELRKTVDREFSVQLSRHMTEFRGFAEKEFGKQRRNLDELLGTLKKEQANLSSRIGQYVEEHHRLKEILAGVSDTARDVEDRIRKAVAAIPRPGRERDAN